MLSKSPSKAKTFKLKFKSKSIQLILYVPYLIILEEALQKLARVLQETLTWFPVVIDLSARLLSSYLFGFDALHNTHSLNDQLHPLGRSLHASHLWE